MRLNYQPPVLSEEFERLCLELLRAHWKCPTLQLYGRRGEKQFGVDIFDEGGGPPLRAAQCKLREAGKTLSSPEIEEEVENAKTFPLKIGHYAILTTGKVTGETQRAIRQMNQAHKRAGLFSIECLSWDKIKDLLHRYTEVVQQVYGSPQSQLVPAVLERMDALTVRLEALVIERDTDAYHAEIDEAKRKIEQGDYQIARYLLTKLRDQAWDKLDARRRFRVLSNMAAAHLGEAQYEKAAALFLEAKSLQPDDERACANEALAHQLLGNPERAFEVATEHRKRHPNSARVVAVWVRNAPGDIPFAALETQVPDRLLNDPEVAFSLAIHAANAGALDRAEEFALKAANLNPEWAYPWLMLARIITKRQLALDLGEQGQLPTDSVVGGLGNAEEYSEKAVGLAKKERAKGVLAEALMTRGLIKEFLGKQQDAEQDGAAAYYENPTSPYVLREYGIILANHGKTDLAISLLRKAVQSDEGYESKYLLAVTLKSRNAPDDASEALQTFIDIAQTATPMAEGYREHILEQAVDLLTREAQWERIENLLVSTPKGTISDVALATFRAIANWRRKDQEATHKWADYALKILSPSTSRHDRRRLARLLTSIGRYSEALPLWQELADPTSLTSDTRNLLGCANRLERHGLLLEWCKRLRESSVRDAGMLDLEISLLERYDVETAIRVLQQHLQEQPDDRMMRLRLSITGLRLSRSELVAAERDVLPSVDEVNPHVGRAVVQVLRMGGHPNEGLEYAYELLRRHFTDIDAHRAYVSALHPIGPEPSIADPETIQPGVAVCFKERGEEIPCWIVIEDSPNPDEARNEKSPDHYMSKQLIGKRPGDTFILAESSVTPRVGKVEAILSKYVYRYQSCMNQWEIRFPEAPEIQLVRLQRQTEKPDEQEIDLAPILAHVKQRKERAERVKKAYGSLTVPIHIVGDALGVNAFDATIGIAGSDDMALKCCFGTTDEQKSALEALATANMVVVDLTALATLAILEGARLLQSLPTEVVISQSTLAELQEIQREKSGQHISLTEVDGKLAIVELTDEQRKELIERRTQFIEAIFKKCKVVGCKAMASIESEKRKVIVESFDHHGAESMVLASAPGAVLWTDDHTLARFALGEFGVRRVWTQVVLQSMTERGLIEATEFVEASAKLLGWRYVFTSPSVPALIRAGQIADWDPDKWPLKGSVDMLRDEVLSLIDSLRLAAGFAVQLFGEGVVSDTEARVTVRVLECLAARKGGLQGVRTIADALPKVSSVNTIGLKRAEKVVRAWLADADKRRLEI